ncbi:MAG: DUF2938 domain-containing protein [Sterolibacteriaceae bacterium MAG5]|nr:DUF2938 domain-containing protein [Candidatus Nitricoxidireducens bremensis]
MTSLDTFRIILIGCGATFVMDVWLILLKRFGVQTLNFAFIGRWFGHLFRGRFMHASINKAPPIPNELLLGWFVHYAVGIAFAGVLVTLVGVTWLREPTWVPAVLVGVCTVAAPFFIMQPAMGSGIAGAKTPAPMKGRLRSVANHAVFGLGLYLSAWLIAWFLR